MLKDEVCANGKQDVSSGIIQDRGSVLKQDSCGSTKQGEYMPFDPREVESQRFYGQDFPAGDLSYGNRGNYMQPQYHNAVDNTSSGSSSGSQGKLFPQHVASYDVEPMGYSTRSSNHILMKATGKSKREQMLPSKYQSSQNEIENAAISAVKMQLGRHYREDGPPLGVNFQSLPPGAFDQDSPNELYYVGDPSTLTVHGNLKELSHDKEEAKYHRNIRSQGPQYSGAHLRPKTCEFGLWNENGRYQSNPKPSLTMYGSHSTRKLNMDGTDEDYMGETSKVKGNMNYEMRCKRGMERIRSDSIARRPLPFGKKSHELSYSKLDDLDNSSFYMREKYNEGKPSNLIVKQNGFLNKEKREHSQRMEKQLYRGKTSTECANLKGEKIQQKQLKGKKKRQVNEFLGQEYMLKAPVPRENLMKGYGGVGDTRISFSENETVGTSSMD
ncbi:hypothetical protein Sjap_002161 [Stephania japonica]|uniref:Uncharacterized protein n=1 Tax=Stephania japonica TaxID=461633 RepID=A0AAP0KLJ2_9MAGN